MGVVEGRAVDVKLAVASLSQWQGFSAGSHVNSDKLRGDLYSGFRRCWLPAPNYALSSPIEGAVKGSERSGDKAKSAKTRSLLGVNEHFEPIFNAVSASAVVLRHPL